jgi:hypothetical protein
MLLLAVFALGAAPATARAKAERLSLEEQTDLFRAETWRWQTLMGTPRSPAHVNHPRADVAYRTWVLRLWHRRALHARRQADRPPHKRHWLCIQGHEADWDANTGNGYYGGLQMDLGFQRRYGTFLLRRKGTADRWAPLEQMWVAERALRAGRGFFPWPNAARICGAL